MNQAGPLGKGNYVTLRGYAGTIGTTTGVTDNYAAIVNDGIQGSNSTFGTTFDPTTTPAPDMGCGWMRATTFSSGATNCPVNLPALTMFNHNAEIVIEHRDNAKPGNSIEIRDGTGTRCLLGFKDAARFRANKATASWDLVNPPKARSATATIEMAATAIGAESGPYVIPASGCRPHHRVAVTIPATGIGGLVVSAQRAEADAVRFWLRNVDGTAPSVAASAAFTARWWIEPL